MADPGEQTRFDAVIAPGERTNSLLVEAGREAWDRIPRLIVVLDAPPSRDSRR